MKCPHCNENHPDDYKFCPITGKQIPEKLLACENKDCIDFGKHILPLNSRFCPRCGASLKSDFSTTSVKNETFKARGVELEMIGIEGGTFWMGAQSNWRSGRNYDCEAYSDESPIHQVKLSDYSIGKYPVTQKLWKAVMRSNPSHFTCDLERPVENLSWYTIVNDFLPKLNDLLKDQLDGRSFILPSEAQWEYAAKGGRKSKCYRYSGSDNIDEVAWYRDNSGDTTHPVGRKKPNELGLYDMSGNVYEWCGDWYGSYSMIPQSNPVGPNSGYGRVLRGGNWFGDGKYCRGAYRGHDGPGGGSSYYGFRLALVRDSH